MPDYSIIQKLCTALHVTLSELMDGEDAGDSSVRVYDDAQILDLLRRTQELERQKGISIWILSPPCMTQLSDTILILKNQQKQDTP